LPVGAFQILAAAFLLDQQRAFAQHVDMAVTPVLPLARLPPMKKGPEGPL
jgi:hypothetical protein